MGDIEGCWHLQGLDPESRILGEITKELIDADAAVRRRYGYDGFPAWKMYRVAIAQDYIYLADMREWVTGFAYWYAKHGGLRPDAMTDELIGAVALDALHILIHTRPLLPPSVMAELIQANWNTYRRFRDSVARMLIAALTTYKWRLLSQMVDWQ